jgi:putative transposase
VSLLVASAVNSEGFRQILGICEDAKEDKIWLVGVSAAPGRSRRQECQLIISDACRGLGRERRRLSTGGTLATLHFYRNVFSHVPAMGAGGGP